MAMSITELERSLTALRLSGMSATLEARALQVTQGDMGFIEALGQLVQDELDRRKSKLLDRRFSLSGLSEKKTLNEFDWVFNPRLPKRDLLELGTCKFIDAREDALLIGAPGVGKSHCAKAIALNAVNRGYTVYYREAHELLPEIHQARELKTWPRLKLQIKQSQLMVIDDLFLRKLPADGCDELTEIIMNRHEKASTMITSNRPVDDWGKLFGDTVAVAPMLDRVMYHGHLLKFEGKSWRLKEASARLAKARSKE
jgi:DNA replication protein DnaC